MWKNVFQITPLIHGVPESQMACPLNPGTGTVAISIPGCRAASTWVEIVSFSVVPSLFNSVISAGVRCGRYTILPIDVNVPTVQFADG